MYAIFLPHRPQSGLHRAGCHSPGMKGTRYRERKRTGPHDLFLPSCPLVLSRFSRSSLQLSTPAPTGGMGNRFSPCPPDRTHREMSIGTTIRGVTRADRRAGKRLNGRHLRYVLVTYPHLRPPFPQQLQRHPAGSWRSFHPRTPLPHPASAHLRI